MSLPIHSDLKTMDFAYRGEPFVYVPAKTGIEVETMDYAYKGMPFVVNPFGVVIIPTLIVVDDLSVGVGIDSMSFVVEATIVTDDMSVATPIEQVNTTATVFADVDNLDIAVGLEQINTSVSANVIAIADLAIIASTGVTGYDPIFVDGDLAVQLDEDQYTRI